MSGKRDVKVSVLCHFWQEDGVWNAKARDLAIVVFGKTFEETQANLQDAIVGHLETAAEFGLLDELIEQLERSTHEPFSIDGMPVDRPMLRMLVAIDDHPHAVAG